MRIAFCGHLHHAKTGSSRFMIEALQRLGSVDAYAPPEGPGGPDLGAVVDGSYDAVVVWQVEWVALRLAEAGLPNVTFFPMYDSCRDHPDSFWRRLAPLKVASFSSTLAARLQRLGVRVRCARYFPEVPPERASPGPELAGFFWRRRPEPGWATIRTLIAQAPFRRFTLHDAPDPDPGPGPLTGPTPEEAARLHLRTTRWYPDAAAARADLLSHNVYFAPRLHEGIGMSFLEAMALGFLVVAPDRPTVNEYLVSGVNGLLYDPDAPGPLELDRARELGRRARETVEAGRERWCRALPALLELVAAPAREVPIRAPLLSLERPRSAAARRARDRAAQVHPRVTVFVLGSAREARTEATLASIAEQDWPSLEWRVLPSGAALDEAVAAARGDYLQFLSPGEVFPSSDALSSVLRTAAAGDDLLLGHSIVRDEEGHEELRAAGDPAVAYAALRRGQIGWRWIERVPAPGAILWRRGVLERMGLPALSRPLAWEEALLRAVREGAKIHHALSVLAVRPAWPHAVRARRAALRAWRAIALRHTERPGDLERALVRMGREAGRRDLARLRALDLLLSLGSVPGSFRELKRRVRTRRALAREAASLSR